MNNSPAIERVSNSAIQANRSEVMAHMEGFVAEKLGSVAGKKVCFVGDGNNTCHSFMQVGAKLGAHVTVCSPVGYGPTAEVIQSTEAMASATSP